MARAAALLLLSIPQAAGANVRPAQVEVDQAVDRGVQFLRSSYASEVGLRDGPGGRFSPRPKPARSRPGERALLAYTLLESGVDAEDALVAHIVTELSFEAIDRTYDAACTLLLLERHDARAHRDWIEELARALLEWQGERGAWGYPADEDLSNTQYAALGLWAAARANVEVPAEVWIRLAHALARFQTAQGGFEYKAGGAGRGKGSMTAAGVGTLALCELELARLGRLRPELVRDLRSRRTRGTRWLAERFRVDANPESDSWTHYWLYGLERMAAFSGLAFVGEHEWYGEGAEWLVRTQSEEGNWNDRTSTCFALLFLSRTTHKSIASMTGPEAHSTALRTPTSAAVRIQVDPSGDRVALRVLGLSHQKALRLEWPGEAGRGPRVARVEYLDGQDVVAVALGDDERPSRGSAFAASARLSRGPHAIRARVFVRPPPASEGADAPEVVLVSPGVAFDIRDEAAAGSGSRPLPGDPDRNLLRSADRRVRCRASSTRPGFDDLPEISFEASRVVDGRRRCPWLARESDEKPALELRLNRAVRANRVRLVGARLAGFPDDELGRPLEVEVSVDGKVVGSLLMPPDPSQAVQLDLDAPLLVGELRLRILSRVRGRRTSAVGLGEVELVLAGEPDPPARELAADPAELLERAVDLPAAGRRAAARELARRRDVSIDTWLATMAAFGRFDPAAPGTSTRRVAKDAGGEPTEIRIHVPRGYEPARPTPLLLVLHGTDESGEEALARWRATSERTNMLLLAPSEPGPSQGATYDDREREAILGALRWTRRRFNVDEDRIHLSGVSRGGHLAWDLALRRPDRFASLVPILGAPRVENGHGRNNLRYLENVATLPIVDLQGARDDPLLVSNVRLAFQKLAAWRAPSVRLVEFPELGHDFDMDAVDWEAFFARAVRDPHAARVVRCVARSGEGRSRWVEALATDREIRETFRPRVDAATWERLSPEAQRERFQELVDERTARVEVVREELGVYRVSSRGVARMRLLLTNDDLPPASSILVRLAMQERTIRVRPDPSVLLEEFVERFDRSFLPVAEVELR